MTMKEKERKMEMIDFQCLYDSLSNQKIGEQKKIAADSCLEVYFGYSFDGNLRLSFLSGTVPPVIESTKILHVVQGCEARNSYWTSFDLLNLDLKDAYLGFCQNLVETVIEIRDERTALTNLKRRFTIWKNLFQKNAGSGIAKEKIMGVLGELIVLNDIIAPKYGMNTAILSWGGPNMHSKDFTVDNTWYEVKSIGANADRIHISSLAQLSSDLEGHLVVVRVEAVSSEFDGTNSAVYDVINAILAQIEDERTETLFVEKIQSLGIDFFGKDMKDKYIVKSVKSFAVKDGFPRIDFSDIKYLGITDVNYAIGISAIADFEER